MDKIRRAALREECQGYLELELYDRALAASSELMESPSGEDRVVGLHVRGRALLLKGRYAEALEACESILATPGPEGRAGRAAALNVKSRCHLLLGEYQEAYDAASLLEVGGTEELAVEARILKAHALSSQGRLEEAMDLARELHENHPEEQTAGFLLARLLALGGDHERALDLLEKLTGDTVRDREVEALRADAMMHVGRLEEAARIFEALLREDPADQGPYIGLGYCYKRLGRLPEAVGILRQLRRRYPTSGIAHFNLACYLALAGERRECLEELALAIGLDESYRRMAREDTDFDPLREDQDFLRLVEDEDHRESGRCDRV